MEESKGERLCIGIARRRPSRCHFDRNLLFVAIWSRRRLRSKVAAHDLPLCGSAPSRCREIATGDAFSCNKKWAANFFSAWGCSSLPTATRPCQRPVHPAPALKTLFATSPARPGAAEMHKRQDARKVGRGHGSKFRPCSG